LIDIVSNHVLTIGGKLNDSFGYRERDEILRLVRDKEIEYNEHLVEYKRRVQFIGSHEVVASTHSLYFPKDTNHFEVPGYKQASRPNLLFH